MTMTAMMVGENLPAGMARDPSDEKMEQIRDLLFGEFQRRSDVRISQLEARIRGMETTFQRQLDAFQARLDGLAGEVHADRRSSFDELARGLQDLSEHVRRIPRD